MSGTEATSRLLETLGVEEGALILLDSSPLIYLVEGMGRRRKAMEAIMEAAVAGSLRLEASVLAWTELLRKAPDPEVALAFRRLLADSERVVLVPVDVAIADAAADILRDRGLVRPDELSLPDAVHLASAFVTGADAVITNDSAWIDLAPRGLRVIILDDLVAAVSML